mgnify:CR=1 FL=1
MVVVVTVIHGLLLGFGSGGRRLRGFSRGRGIVILLGIVRFLILFILLSLLLLSLFLLNFLLLFRR